MTEGIEGKVVLILGGGGGIGSVTARALAERGAIVALADIDADKLAATVDLVEAAGGTVRGHRVDVTAREQLVAVVDAVVDEFGRLDTLINSAGVMYIRPIAELNTAEWDATVDLNVKGTLWGVAAALPVFLEQRRGHFLMLGSVHGLKVINGGAVHSASKFAVNAFAEGLRVELAPHGIRVTSVLPGAVDTGMQDKTTGTEGELMRQIYAKAIAPQAIARAITFVIEQPDDVAVNQIVVRLTSQEI